MKNYRINFDNLVRQLLPVHKRQPRRLGVLRSLISPLRELYRDFEQWRDDIRRRVNMTGQVFVLESYLRSKYNGIGIRIETHDDDGWQVGFEAEGELYAQPVALSSEGPEYLPWIALKGEKAAELGGADFKVIVTLPYDREDTDQAREQYLRDMEDVVHAIRTDVDKYKLALVTYKLIVQLNTDNMIRVSGCDVSKGFYYLDTPVSFYELGLKYTMEAFFTTGHESFTGSIYYFHNMGRTSMERNQLRVFAPGGSWIIDSERWNTTYYVVVVSDPENHSRTIYLNGKILETHYFDGINYNINPPGEFETLSRAIILGRDWSDWGQDRTFKGTLHSFRLFDGPLSREQVEKLWNRGDPASFRIDSADAMRGKCLLEYLPETLTAEVWNNAAMDKFHPLKRDEPALSFVKPVFKKED